MKIYEWLTASLPQNWEESRGWKWTILFCICQLASHFLSWQAGWSTMLKISFKSLLLEKIIPGFSLFLVRAFAQSFRSSLCSCSLGHRHQLEVTPTLPWSPVISPGNVWLTRILSDTSPNKAPVPQIFSGASQGQFACIAWTFLELGFKYQV